MAETVYEWKLDEASIAAALLHRTIEDTAITNKDITNYFGNEIAFLVDGLTKLKKNVLLLYLASQKVKNIKTT